MDVSGEGTGACPVCGKNAILTTVVDTRFAYGSGKNAVTLTAAIPVHRCLECGFECTDHKAEEARDLAVRRHLHVMTARQIRLLRESCGLSQREFGALTRIGEASLVRWETGQIIQNAGYDQFLYLLGFPDNVRRLRKRAATWSKPRMAPDVAADLESRFPSLRSHAKIVRIASQWKLHRAS